MLVRTKTFLLKKTLPIILLFLEKKTKKLHLQKQMEFFRMRLKTVYF